jgi:hypothetical protein
MKKALTLVLVVAFLAVLCPTVQAQKAGTASQSNEPTEKTFGLTEKILGYDAPPPGPPTEESIRREKAAVQYPGNASMNYRGVVFDNFNSTGSYGEEMAVDFGSLGIFVRDNTWNQISGLNPTWMISGAIGADQTDSELIAGFGSNGVWVWEYSGYPGTWTQISGAYSYGAFIVNDDFDIGKELYVDFASLGLWRHEYHNLASWMQVSGLNMSTGLRMNTYAAAIEEACAMFPTYGVWRMWYTGTSMSITQLSGTVTSEDDHASAKFTGGTAEDLVIDFGTLGLWLCQENDQSWHQIDTGSINRVREVYFIGNPDAELLILYNGSPAGLWMWNYGTWPGSLTQLTAMTPDADGFVEPLDINGGTETNGDQEVAVDLGANGLWIYDNTDQSWTQISALNPVFMVAGDYWNHGYNDTLAVDFGTNGFWRYTASTGSWTHLSGASPDSTS